MVMRHIQHLESRLCDRVNLVKNWSRSGVHRGNGKLFGAARDMTTSIIKKTECGDESTENEECMPSESDTNTEKKSLLSGIRRGIRKLFGAARVMTTSFIKNTLSVLKLDVKIFRKYKKRFDKHTDCEQVRWWFEIWGDESALKVLESKWEQVSVENKWRLETCPVIG